MEVEQVTQPTPPKDSTAKLRFQLPVLARLQAEEPQAKKKGRQQSRRCRRADRLEGWTSKSASYKTYAVPEGEEVDDIDNLGKDRRRRYLNDKILREMAGGLLLNSHSSAYSTSVAEFPVESACKCAPVPESPGCFPPFVSTPRTNALCAVDSTSGTVYSQMYHLHAAACNDMRTNAS